MSGAHSHYQLNTNKPLAWLVLCVFFVLSTIVAPANALALAVPVDLSIDTGSIKSEANSHSSHRHAKTGQSQKDMLGHSLHHAGMTDKPCHDPACDNMPQCSDDCSMSSCTSSSTNCVPLPSAMQATITHGVTACSVGANQHLVVRSIDPLFRPPIL